MTIVTLNFNGVDLTAVDSNDAQVWVTSSDLAKALGYKHENAVSKIYNRNAGEFTDSMTRTVENPRLPNMGMRIFSLRGCHLIAMFARTKVAKDFRVWVLNVIDSHIAKESTYKLGDLQKISDQIDAEYAIGFSVASVGGKAMNEWKGKKHKLEAKKEIVQELMQPLLTGFDEARAVGVVK